MSLHRRRKILIIRITKAKLLSKATGLEAKVTSAPATSFTLALNDGEWRVIVQDVSYYTQTQRVETCLFAGASCRTLAPCHRSSCVQKYVHHRMLSFDPCNTYKGLFIDIFKLPSACSCRVPA